MSAQLDLGALAPWETSGEPIQERFGAFELGFFGRASLAFTPPRDHRSPGPAACAWLEQRHSDVTRVAREAGLAGAGDALVSAAPDLALVVVTADCVPILVARGAAVAAIHAGWRGLVSGVVPRALGALATLAPDDSATAWIGPAIGPCCYEVGPDVAAAVVAASDPRVLCLSPGADRPHLDLPLAAAAQLGTAGVASVRLARRCTRCEAALWWSFRRDATAVGRNRAMIRRRSSRDPR